LDNHEVSDFETYLPIQMDATCNGFQHLSLLSLDPSLGAELNLTESCQKDKPKDFYNFLMTSLTDYFKTEIENNTDLSLEIKESYTRLIESKLNRYIIKKSVMTIPYNVSSYQLVNYIKENFYRINNTE
jgi:DNA-directed RNA polymerase